MNHKQRQKRKQRYQQEQNLPADYRYRRWFLLGLFALASASIVVSAAGRQVFETDFLQQEGKRRHLSVVKMPAYRGMIKDRRGEVLAVSTPVDSVWVNPRAMPADAESIKPLANALGMKVSELQEFLGRYSSRAFVFLKRRISPDAAADVEALSKEMGVNAFGLQREYRRYYPAGEVFSHVIGFTDVDDVGQEGIELVYNGQLEGEHGQKYVIRDGKRRVVNDIEQLSAPKAGTDLVLSLDARLQYLAYKAVKAAKIKNKAKAVSAVVLDVKTGEVLAMVNQPGYNPNGSRSNRAGRLRNRVLTDVYEPGSTMKPFAVAAGLEKGVIRDSATFDTAPGYYYIGRHIVRDHHNNGVIDLETLLKKSSNVGASQIALKMEPQDLFAFMSGLGFGKDSGTLFPGEAAGQLRDYSQWAKIDQATLSYGYGLSVSTLQLARAYAALGNGGVMNSVSLFKTDKAQVSERVMSEKTARTVIHLLEAVTAKDGTAPQASVEGYRVAGKTGTVKKYNANGYEEKRYRALFAGVAPADNPRLAMAVVVDEPDGGKFYGGDVAAPVFSEVMAGGLRLLNIAPDAMDGLQVAGLGGQR